MAAYGTYKVSKMVKDKKSVAAGKRHLEQMEYLKRNINNIQGHYDPAKTSGLYESTAWKHAYQSTLRSRQMSIKGDRSLYGDTSKRDAHKETVKYMYDALRNGNFDRYISGESDPNDTIWNRR